MAKYYRELTEELSEFIKQQPLFFVATAPADDGRINVSPKGYDTFTIIDESHVAYLDYTGSGNETYNHIGEHGKITIMWCSFTEKPLVLRIYGYAHSLHKGSEAYIAWMDQYYPAVDKASARRIVLIDVESVNTSCGYGVPLMQFQEERETMRKWTENKLAHSELDEYIAKNAQRSEEKFPLKNKN